MVIWTEKNTNLCNIGIQKIEILLPGTSWATWSQSVRSRWRTMTQSASRSPRWCQYSQTALGPSSQWLVSSPLQSTLSRFRWLFFHHHDHHLYHHYHHNHHHHHHHHLYHHHHHVFISIKWRLIRIKRRLWTRSATQELRANLIPRSLSWRVSHIMKFMVMKMHGDGDGDGENAMWWRWTCMCCWVWVRQGGPLMIRGEWRDMDEASGRHFRMFQKREVRNLGENEPRSENGRYFVYQAYWYFVDCF